jgi:hypothetical protein
MPIDGMIVDGMVMAGMPIGCMFIGGMGIPIDIIMFAEGRQRSSNCSKIGR